MAVLEMEDVWKMEIVNANTCGEDQVVLYLYAKIIVLEMGNALREDANVTMDSKE